MWIDYQVSTNVLIIHYKPEAVLIRVFRYVLKTDTLLSALVSGDELSHLKGFHPQVSLYGLIVD